MASNGLRRHLRNVTYKLHKECVSEVASSCHEYRIKLRTSGMIGAWALISIKAQYGSSRGGIRSPSTRLNPTKRTISPGFRIFASRSRSAIRLAELFDGVATKILVEKKSETISLIVYFTVDVYKSR